MLRLLKDKKAQNTLEYALIIAVVIGAFTAMQLYNRRAIQARLKSGVDNIPAMVLGQESEKDVSNLLGKKTQYEPYYYVQGEYKTDSASSEGTEKGIVTEKGGKRDLSGAISQRTMKQTVASTEGAD